MTCLPGPSRRAERQASLRPVEHRRRAVDKVQLDSERPNRHRQLDESARSRFSVTMASAGMFELAQWSFARLSPAPEPTIYLEPLARHGPRNASAANSGTFVPQRPESRCSASYKDSPFETLKNDLSVIRFQASHANDESEHASLSS